MAEAADWANLNKDLVAVIGEKLDSCTDYVRFRAACLGWKSSLPQKPPKRLQRRRFPYMLLPPKSSNFPLLSSLDLDGGIVDQLQLPPRVGGRGDDFCYRGFSKGWLIVIEKEGPSIYLINPFTGDQKLLPPLNTFPLVFRYYPDRVGKEFIIRRDATDNIKVFTYSGMYFHYIRKVVLSSSPTSTNCLAMAIHGEFLELAYCRYGDDRWSSVVQQRGYSFGDIIFYKDKFFAVAYSLLRVVVVDVSNLDFSPTAVLIAAPPPPSPLIDYATRLYLVLVESSSSDHHLLVVARDIDSFDQPNNKDLYETVNFEVLKLNLDSRNFKWGKWSDNRLTSLDNHILFLGWNDSMSLPAHNFPGCKADLIYFTDDYFDGHDERSESLDFRGSDVGVFDLENNTVKRLAPLQHPQALWPPPIWVQMPLICHILIIGRGETNNKRIINDISYISTFNQLRQN